MDASAGAVEEVERIVKALRRVWPEVQIILRADSGFCREPLMKWCEEQGVDFVFGLARNRKLEKILGAELQQAQQEFARTGKAARVFEEFSYRTKKSWSRARRVVAKAEHLAKGANPRFIVTSLGPEWQEGRKLYEEFYCARGEMENRIKEQQLALFADRTSTASSALQPTAAVLFLDRLLLAAGAAAVGADRDRDGEGAVPDDPGETAQDWGADPSDGAEGVGIDGQRLPVCGGVWSRFPEPGAGTAGRLTGNREKWKRETKGVQRSAFFWLKIADLKHRNRPAGAFGWPQIVTKAPSREATARIGLILVPRDAPKKGL